MKSFTSTVAIMAAAVTGSAALVATQVSGDAADLPEIKLSAQDFLDTYCQGKVLMSETEVIELTEGTYDGDCSIVLGERGEWQTGKFGTMTITGALSVVVDAATPREVELQLEEGSTLIAGSMELAPKELQVKKGATLTTTDGDLMVAALRKVQVEEMATISAEAGSISLTAGREVELKKTSTLIASGSVSASAPKCVVEPPITVMADEKNLC